MYLWNWEKKTTLSTFDNFVDRFLTDLTCRPTTIMKHLSTKLHKTFSTTPSVRFLTLPCEMPDIQIVTISFFKYMKELSLILTVFNILPLQFMLQ